MFPLCYSIENGKFVLNDTENVVVENFVGIEKTNELLSEMEKLYEKSTFHDFFLFFQSINLKLCLQRRKFCSVQKMLIHL